MPEILKRADLLEEDGVPEVQVGPRGVEPCLDAQGFSGVARLFEPVGQLGAHQKVDDPALEQRELLRHRRKGWHARAGYLSSSAPPVMGRCRLSLTISFSSLPTLKKGKRLAGTSTGWPVRGLRPEYGL